METELKPDPVSDGTKGKASQTALPRNEIIELVIPTWRLILLSIRYVDSKADHDFHAAPNTHVVTAGLFSTQS